VTYEQSENNVSREKDVDQELFDGLPNIDNSAHMGLNDGLSGGWIGLLQTVPKFIEISLYMRIILEVPPPISCVILRDAVYIQSELNSTLPRHLQQKKFA
jgi:hypothetical protein